ncbi:MAG: STAS domain-containing protein [Ignavibacteria bacterium]|nr:STAS domain-containing protein [Ignavibacteria bacterium]
MVTIEYDKERNKTSLLFDGRMDTLTSQEAKVKIDNHFLELFKDFKDRQNIDHDVIFDLRDVSFVSSMFLRLCVEYSQKIQDGKFSIINTDPFVKKTFKISGLDEKLNLI